MKKKILALVFVGVLVISGCSRSTSEDVNDSTSVQEEISDSETSENAQDVIVKFGEDGKEFIMKSEKNDTAIEVIKYIGEEGKNLPIYEYDNFEGSEYFQYYDIPSSYEIPSNPKKITSEKAGEVYYSDPNRVLLFYRDAKIEGAYTKIGEIENIDGLRRAVEDNPVIEGWDNKIISLSYKN